MKYDVGQYVMYRNNGVCRIEAIGKLGFLQNSDKEYYTLQIGRASCRERV